MHQSTFRRDRSCFRRSGRRSRRRRRIRCQSRRRSRDSWSPTGWLGACGGKEPALQLQLSASNAFLNERRLEVLLDAGSSAPFAADLLPGPHAAAERRAIVCSLRCCFRPRLRAWSGRCGGAARYCGQGRWKPSSSCAGRCKGADLCLSPPTLAWPGGGGRGARHWTGACLRLSPLTSDLIRR